MVGPMQRAVIAAFAYFTLTFAAGFALGTLRTLLLAPRLGEMLAVIIEVPIMLTIAWWACGWDLRRFRVSHGTADRALMGLVAFALLMMAEAAVAIFLFGRTLAQHIVTFAEPAAEVGLAAQLVYAAFPLFRRR